jgi:hypothetical protein
MRDVPQIIKPKLMNTKRTASNQKDNSRDITPKTSKLAIVAVLFKVLSPTA